MTRRPGGALRWAASIALLVVCAPARAAEPRRVAGPLAFEVNRGQTDARVRYLARGEGYTVFLTEAEAVVVLAPRTDDADGAIVKMRPVGGAPDGLSAEDRLPGRVNYRVGNDPSRWQSAIETFRRVRWRDVWPGVDVVFRGTGERLEYDVVVAAAADPGKIGLRFVGAERVRVDGDGSLVVETAAGSLRQAAPAVHQEIDGVRRHVSGAFRLTDGDVVGFVLGDYDRRYPVVIDPPLVRDADRSLHLDRELEPHLAADLRGRRGIARERLREDARDRAADGGAVEGVDVEVHLAVGRRADGIEDEVGAPLRHGDRDAEPAGLGLGVRRERARQVERRRERR